MKILLYNIGYSTGLKGSRWEYFVKGWRYFLAPREKIHQICDFLREQNADIVCLLETDSGSFRSRFNNHVRLLADRLASPFWKSVSRYHPASLWRRLPLFRKQESSVFSRAKGRVKRYYLKSGMKKLVLEFHVGNISVFLVHLGVLYPSLRRRQMEELSVILDQCKRPYIVCGDFNIFKGLEEMKDFVERQKLKLVESGATFPSICPRLPLDLFLVSKEIRIKATGVCEALFSDHRPVWIEVNPDIS